MAKERTGWRAFDETTWNTTPVSNGAPTWGSIEGIVKAGVDITHS